MNVRIDNPRVDDFGDRLKKVRLALKRKAIDLARQAVAPSKDEGKIRDLANYISRFETGKATNPSLDMLEQLAKGCGLTLVAFIESLERQTAADYHMSESSVTKPSSSPPRTGTASGHGASVSASTLSPAAQIERLAALVRSAGDTLAAASDAIRDQPASQQARTDRGKQSRPGRARS